MPLSPNQPIRAGDQSGQGFKDRLPPRKTSQLTNLLLAATVGLSGTAQNQKTSEHQEKTQQHQEISPQQSPSQIKSTLAYNRNASRQQQEEQLNRTQTASSAGKNLQRAGSAASAAGTGMQVAGKTAQAAGAVAEGAGKGVQAAGKGIGKVGDALNKTKYGAILGAPLKAVGVGTQAAGKGVEAGGKGVKAAGKGVDKAGKGVKKAGKKAKETGKHIQKTSDKIARQLQSKHVASTGKNMQPSTIQNLPNLGSSQRPSEKKSSGGEENTTEEEEQTSSAAEVDSGESDEQQTDEEESAPQNVNEEMQKQRILQGVLTQAAGIKMQAQQQKPKDPEAEKMAKRLIPRGAAYVGTGIGNVLDLSFAGGTIVINIFIYMLTLGFLNYEMLTGTLSWDPIPMPIDKKGTILSGIIIFLDIMVFLAVVVLFCMQMFFLLLLLAPHLALLYFGKAALYGILG